MRGNIVIQCQKIKFNLTSPREVSANAKAADYQSDTKTEWCNQLWYSAMCNVPTGSSNSRSISEMLKTEYIFYLNHNSDETVKVVMLTTSVAQQ